MNIEEWIYLHKQPHLKKDIEKLSSLQKEHLSKQIHDFDPDVSFSSFLTPKQITPAPLLSCNPPILENYKLGQKLIMNYQTACIVLAGGIGTRLGSAEPKGCFPISNVQNKSLFQLVAEKILAQGKQLGCRPLVAFMLSSSTQEKTVSFFKQHQYWGLDPSQVFFFSQKNTPYYDNEGNWFWSREGVIAESPDGNGYLFQNLDEASIFSQFKQAGVEYVQVIQIDNPLVSPLDPYLIGSHAKLNADILIGAISRDQVDEKLGLLTFDQKKIHITEYSEIPECAFVEKNKKGVFKYPYGNSGIFSFSMAFIERLLNHAALQLPPHWVKKKTKSWNHASFEEIWAWKVEHFIFDLLAYAKKVDAIHLDRKDYYASLKSKEGPQGIQAVKEALLEKDIRTFEKISRHSAKEHFFELAPAFYYPTEKLLQYWENRPFPNTSYLSEK